MTKQFKAFPSIGQFRNTIKAVKDSAEYHNKPLPTLTFLGTVKLHGTNAGIGYDPTTGEVWAQSRSRIITPEKDNAGFAMWVYANKEDIVASFKAFGVNSSIVLFGEWCGEGIQKGVALNELPKMFVAFAQYYKGTWELPAVTGFKTILDFPHYQLEIDFERPELSVDKLQEITKAVEDECPVGKSFGVSGIGEGVVWSSDWLGNFLQFKVKGEKHSSSKVKTLASVDIEKMDSIEAFVEYAVTQNRLEQGIKEVFGENPYTQKQTGDFVRWIANDVIKEEIDTLAASGLTWKDVASKVSKKASGWFLSTI